MRWLRAAERAGVGAALAAVALACGLAQYSREPVMPGAAPGASFATATLSQPGAATGAREALTYAALGSIARSGVGGEWVTSLPLTREMFVAGRSVGRQTLGWSTGPLFESLHVPLVGRALPARDLATQLHGAAEREIVLTRHAARAWFGSVEDAVGKTVELEPIGAASGPPGNVDFLVVGVVQSAFAGPSPDRVVMGWVPLGAWPGVVMPRSFGAALAQLRPEYLGIETRPDAATAAAALNAVLADQASPVRVTLSRGLGLTAQHRAVLTVWSRTLLLDAIAIGAVFAAMYLSSRLVQLLKDEMPDAIRVALGESGLRRWRRRCLAELRGVATTLLVALAVLFVAWQAAPRLPEFPIRASIGALATGWSAALAFIALVGVLAMAPPALSRFALGVPSLMRARRNQGSIKASNLALIGLSFAAVVLAAGAAGITFGRMHTLLDRDLGFDSAGAWYAEIRRDAAGDRGMPVELDGRPLASVIADARADARDADIALASATPVGAPQVVSASIGGRATEGSELVSINFVTPSYFHVLGIGVHRLCAPLGEESAQQVIVNEAFMRRYGAADGTPPSAITAQVPNAGGPREYSICGVASDAQYLDARAAPLPAIYAALTRIGNAGAVIGRGNPDGPLARVAAALANATPEYRVMPARSLSQRIADDLRSDEALAAMSLLLSVFVVALSTAMCILTLTAAAAMLEHEVAVRWSLGSNRLRLATSLLATRKPWPIAACVLVNAAATIAIFALAPERPTASVLPVAACAFLLAALSLSATIGVIARRFSDRAMARVLDV